MRFFKLEKKGYIVIGIAIFFILSFLSLVVMPYDLDIITSIGNETNNSIGVYGITVNDSISLNGTSINDWTDLEKNETINFTEVDPIFTAWGYDYVNLINTPDLTDLSNYFNKSVSNSTGFIGLTCANGKIAEFQGGVWTCGTDSSGLSTIYSGNGYAYITGGDTVNVNETALSDVEGISLVGDYQFDTNVSDSSIYNNDGILSGDSEIKQGLLVLDGTTAYATLPDFSSSFDDEATIIGWIKLQQNTSTSVTYTGLWELQTGASATHYPYTNSLAYIGTFRSARVDSIVLSPDIDRTKWHMITITTKAGANGWNFYQNDELIKTETGEATVSIDGSNMWLGGQSVVFLRGEMDNVKIYNRSLTSKEITNIYDEENIKYGHFNELKIPYKQSTNTNLGSFSLGDVVGHNGYASAITIEGGLMIESPNDASGLYIFSLFSENGATRRASIYQASTGVLNFYNDVNSGITRFWNKDASGNSKTSLYIKHDKLLVYNQDASASSLWIDRANSWTGINGVPTTDFEVFGDTRLNGDLEVTGDFSAKRPYGMFSSNISQVITVADIVNVINFTHVEDTWQIECENNENITVQQSGDYLITLSVVVVTDSNNKHFDVFPQTTHGDGVTMVNVPRSNTQIEIETAGTEQVISVSFILDLNSGDKFRIMYSSDDAGSMTVWHSGHGIGANAIPETPSIIMTVTKVSEITD